MGVRHWCTTYPRYYGIIIGVGISIVVLDIYTILVKYVAREYGVREKNDKSAVLCVLCVVKTVIYYNNFTNGKYETYI